VGHGYVTHLALSDRLGRDRRSSQLIAPNSCHLKKEEIRHDSRSPSKLIETPADHPVE
jgi:hypothetical protein